MSGEEAAKIFSQHLSNYEREEIKEYETVYYVNTHVKKKSFMNEPSENESEGKFNYGYDTEDGDYLYDVHDHIQYRYEILKKLGKGAFGVVLKCMDHLKQEAVALKILKN